jgi:aspartyl-tRNA(Asn)/glutamyl-tRNA(Gln) amidotransferase subunit B
MALIKPYFISKASSKERVKTLAITDQYDIVIGLETHCQMKTKTKLFCSCKNEFGCAPNANTCPVCLGMPGTLPVLNRQAFDYAIKAALAIGCTIAKTTKFDRKHYFYPDLPKGYQITQFDEPYCRGGGLEVQLEDGTKSFVQLDRIHMEEDAGKLSHAADSHIADSIVDLNRAGTPLMEIVTEPVITSAEEAYAYLTKLKQLLEYIGVSDCNMQEGSLRCDVNISLKPKGSKTLGTKVEIKNMNSFKGAFAAINYEVKRQYKCIQTNVPIVQETRSYDPDKDETAPMRSKEQANDYRYFPDPDLPRFEISDEWVSSIRQSLGELPEDRRERFKKDYQLPDYDIEQITYDRELGDYYEAIAQHNQSYKEISNWIMGEVSRELSDRKITIVEFELKAQDMAGLINCIDNSLISKKIAKENVFPEMIQSREAATAVIERLGLKVESDDSVLIPIIQEAIKSNPKAIADIKAGKGKAIGSIIGTCMKATKGKADPGTLSKLVQVELSKMT